MIFNLSYKWLKEYLPKAPPAKELARLLSLHSVSVERWHDLGEGLDKLVVGEITGIEPHPDALKLKLVDTKIGLLKSLKIVCGGSNLAVGQKVAVALPGARVRWHGEGDLVELKPAKIRGVESAGMICAAEEIGLADLYPKRSEHEILDLSKLKVKAGTPLREAVGLDDTVMEVEATTNRPDLLSVVGVAREAAAILGEKMTVPSAVIPSGAQRSRGISFRTGTRPLDKLGVTVTIEDKKLCPRYQAVAVSGLKVQPSPNWLQERLRAAGLRPINNVVDVTNYVLLELGQPLHAFDRQKINKQIIVRRAKQGEKLSALDGKEYSLTPEILVIADAIKPLAIAGVMGGEASGVTASTNSTILESANFDPVSVRRTARALNLYSQSQLRFEKGLSPEGTEPALRRALELLQEISSGQLAVSALTDIWPIKPKPKVYNLDLAEVAKLIGVAIPAGKIKSFLTSLGFQVVGDRAKFKVTAPYWRAMDIEDSHDLIEEIARLFGYHNLPAVLPEGQIPVTSPDQELDWESRLKNDLAGAGLTEVYTYSFVSGDLLQKTGWEPKDLVKINNPLSEEFEYMRPSLIPGTLAAVALNQENFASGQIFEISKVYRWPSYAPAELRKGKDKQGELPTEELRLIVAVWGADNDGAEFFKVKGILESLFEKYHLSYKFSSTQNNKLVHPARSVEILIKNKSAGVLAEIHPSVLESLKIAKRLAVGEFPLRQFMEAASRVGSYQPISLFPAVKRDLAVVVDRKTGYANIISEIKSVDPLINQVELFDVYTGAGVPAGKKSLALHLLYQSAERTLNDAEVSAIHERVTKVLEQKFGALIR